MEEWRERARLAAEMVGFVPSSSSTVPNLARGGGRDTGMSGSRGGSDEPDVERVREVDGSRGLSREAFRLFFREYKERATSKERAALLNSLPVAVRCQFQVILDKLERHRSGRRDKGNKEERSIRHREKNNKKNNNKDNQEKETNQKKVASKDKAQQTMKKYFDGLRALPRVMRHRAFAKFQPMSALLLSRPVVLRLQRRAVIPLARTGVMLWRKIPRLETSSSSHVLIQ